MGHTRVVVAVGLVAIAACVDVSGLSGAGSPDAGDADASSDAGPDGGEAGTDASQDAADAAAFCASLSPPPLFCADFDEGPTALDLSHWSSKTINPKDGGTLTLDPTASQSPPASLLATFSGAVGGGGAALTTPVLASAPSSIHLELAVRTNAGPAQNTDVFVLRFGTAYGLDLLLAESFAALNEAYTIDGGTSYFQHTFVTAPQKGVWSKIAVDVSFTTRTLTATVDGFVAANGTIRTEAQTGPVSLEVGVEYTTSTTTESFNIDDIVVSTP